MASLQRFVPIKARESVLAAASATVSARQRVSVDWSEASNAIKSISAVPVDILTDEQKKIATDLLVHVHTSEDNNLDSAIVIRQLNAWMNSWLETAQFRNLRWEEVIIFLDSVIRTELVSELAHLDDFIGYHNLTQIDDDLHYAIHHMKAVA